MKVPSFLNETEEDRIKRLIDSVKIKDNEEEDDDDEGAISTSSDQSAALIVDKEKNS